MLRTPILFIALLAVGSAGAHPFVYDVGGDQHQALTQDVGPIHVEVRLDATGLPLYYVSNNDGPTLVAQETNGALTGGTRDYGHSERDTGLQVHDTCLGLATESDVDAWQGDRFFNYVPWQTTATGFNDGDASAWLDLWLGKGYDLAAATDLAALCEDASGVFLPHDAYLLGPVGLPLE